MKSLISVSDVTKRYGPNVVLDNVSLDIHEGEFVALLGPSGCGKTTLLRSIAGFIQPDSGDIRIGDVSVIRLPPDRRPVNMVFQNYALFPHLSVAKNVAFGPVRQGIRGAELERIVSDALETVGMAAFANRLPSQMSGGQQQRVALARAIANKPKVLLLDEPLGALDLKLRKRMQLELKELQQKLGITFLFVTHDQEEALVMADRIVVMDSGRIAQVGSGEAIYTTPASRYVADFIGEANLIDCVRGSNGNLVVKGTEFELPYKSPAGSDGATLLIRPEDMTIGKENQNMVQLPGTIKDKVFVGNTTRIYVEALGGLTLMVSYAERETTHMLVPGQSVDVAWKRESARPLAD